MTDLKICTWNIHKGFSQFNRRMVIHELRERLHALDPDLVFLQEVQGQHHGHAERHADWPSAPQYEFLADQMWPATAYGRNAVYDHGHHGNAILSRHPISHSGNFDMSAHRFEQRGLLHCVIEPGGAHRVHALCVHLGLTARGRRQQYAMLAEHIRTAIPPDDGLIVAGDFNDWHNRAEEQWSHALGLQEAHSLFHGRPARSFPAAFPLLRLDRIYVRGVAVREVKLHSGPPWSRVSDHAALTARLTLGAR
jgi:endonuclease/exonuclease/phosphatase family metal-dependent hydrolase